MADTHRDSHPVDTDGCTVGSLLRYATQFPAQQGDADWQVGLRHTAVSLPVRDGATVTQAAAPFLARNVREVRPLRSTGITPLPHYYEPVRLPADAVERLGFPSAVAQLPARVAGSPRTLHPSVIARPPQSPRTARCVRVLVTSAPVAGFSTFGRLAAAIGVTRPNRVRMRWAHDFAHHDNPLSCARLHRSAGPTRFAPSVTLWRRTGATC